MTLRCRERGLTIAVYDSRPDLLLPLRPVAEGQQGRGLFMVAALSLHWGVRQGRDEKCVWAFLPATPSVTYSHSVRMAAHQAVRVVLLDEPGECDAADGDGRRLGHGTGRGELRDHAGGRLISGAGAVHAAPLCSRNAVMAASSVGKTCDGSIVRVSS